jgi:hypothetical protein
MIKKPSFDFYPIHWRRDLDDCPLEIEGAWIRICCRLWDSDTIGKATKSLDEWARVLRRTEKKSMKILKILIDSHVASGEILDNQNITIICRRMMRDDRVSKIRSKAGKLGGNPAFRKRKDDCGNQGNLLENLDKQNEKNLVNQTSKQNCGIYIKDKHNNSFGYPKAEIPELKDEERLAPEKAKSLFKEIQERLS